MTPLSEYFQQRLCIFLHHNMTNLNFLILYKTNPTLSYI